MSKLSGLLAALGGIHEGVVRGLQTFPALKDKSAASSVALLSYAAFLVFIPTTYTFLANAGGKPVPAPVQEAQEAAPPEQIPEEAPTASPAPVSTAWKKLKADILKVDQRGQKALAHVDRQLEQFLDTGSENAKEKIEETIGACRGVAADLEELASGHMGEVSIMDTVPGNDAPKSEERQCAEAAGSFADSYAFYAESLSVFLEYADDPEDRKKLKRAKEEIKNATVMRQQALMSLP